MKTLAASFLITLAMTIQSAAQVKVGARMGLQLTTITGEAFSYGDRVLRTGVNGGIVMDVGRKVAFSTGFLMSTQGYKAVHNEDEYTLRMAYLRIPMEVKVHLGKSDKTVSGYIHAGPSLAAWTRGKRIIVDYGERESETYIFRKEYDRRIDVGLGAGGGISLNFGKHIVQAGPSFVMGLLDFNKYPNGKPSYITSKYLHVVAGVMNVTYLFMAKE